MQSNPGQDLQAPVMISMTSGKGGVGKTSLAVNLAVALSQRNRRILLVDGDLGLANVDVLLRLNAEKTIRDLLEDSADPLSTIICVEPNLSVLPACSGVPRMLQMGEKEQLHLGSILKRIVAGFDYVLVDTAAGIGPSVMWLNTFVDHNFVVVTPDPTSMTDAYALIKVLATEHDRREFHILLNLVRNDREAQEVFNTLTDVTSRFLDLHPIYLGAVPQDVVVARAVRDQLPFIRRAPGSKAALAIFNVAEQITG